VSRKRQWAEKQLPPDAQETCPCGAKATQERVVWEGRNRRVEHYCDDCAKALSFNTDDLDEMT
jgi:hypothetical protein